MAIAKAYYDKLGLEPLEATLSNAALVKKTWMARRCDAPGETKFIGIESDRDDYWVCAAISKL